MLRFVFLLNVHKIDIYKGNIHIKAMTYMLYYKIISMSYIEG